MTRKILLLILGFISCHAFSQDEDCVFSDDNYYLQVLIVTDDTLDVDYNKDDFILHLETNSAITEADAQFLNEHLVEVYRQYPNSTGDPGQKYVYVVSDDETVEALFNTYTESVSAIYLYCDCEAENGTHQYYARVIADEFPSDDYNKTDFINHIIANSAPTDDQLDFLNTTIIEVRNAFQGAQSVNLRNTLMVTSNYDILVPFLHDFPESFNFVEYICNNATLSVQDNDASVNTITIFPNPIVRNSTINIDNQFVEELFIYDVTGKLLETKTMKGLHTIPMNEFDLKSGIYFLKFTSRKGHITKKVIVK